MSNPAPFEPTATVAVPPKADQRDSELTAAREVLRRSKVRAESARQYDSISAAEYEEAVTESTENLLALVAALTQQVADAWDEGVAAAAQFVGDNAYVVSDFGERRGVEITAWLLQNTGGRNPYRSALGGEGN
jgi:hypothetical protein